MRIVNFQQFMALPAGTVYQSYTPCVAKGGLEVKWQNCGDRDWVCQALDGPGALECSGSDQMHDRLEEMQASGASYPADYDCAGRAGGAEDGAMFLVFDPADVRMLIAVLGKAVGM